MYLYGGYSGSQRLGDMYAYDFEIKSVSLRSCADVSDKTFRKSHHFARCTLLQWSEIDCSNGEAPSGRSSLVTQVYENYLYVFGGYNGHEVMSDFYKFRLKPIGVPPSGLVNDFKRLVNDREMSDVCFLVEGQEVYAHRAILAVRSEYFRVLLFNGHMRESVQAVEDGNMSRSGAPIEVQNVSHTVFLKVLEYLYTDTIQHVTLELGIHLLVASEQFLLDRLKALCEDIIRRGISEDNVISILVTSPLHNALGLKEMALEFILLNLTNEAIQKGLSVS